FLSLSTVQTGCRKKFPATLPVSPHSPLPLQAHPAIYPSLPPGFCTSVFAAGDRWRRSPSLYLQQSCRRPAPAAAQTRPVPLFHSSVSAYFRPLSFYIRRTIRSLTHIDAARRQLPL